MLTSNTRGSRVSTALVVVAAVLVAGVLFVRLGIARSGADGSLPADIRALGTTVVPAAPDGMVSQDQAVQVAESQFGIKGHKTSAYLVDLTNPNLLGGVTNRAFWIIKVEGIIIDPSLPYGGNGPPSVVEAPTTLYVYIDAATGEFTTAHAP